jgi:MFS family permease
MQVHTEAAPVPYQFMLPIVLGTMMNPLNSTMLATALIPLCNSFRISIGQGAILVTSLYITSTIAQPLMGRLADIFSAKTVYMSGYGLVMLSALLGLFAPAFSWLIASRILMGLGTSASYPSAMALLNKKYAEEGTAVPGNVLGIIGISAQVSMILGPVLGGVLTQCLGWKGIFFINIPWVIAAVYLSKAIPADLPAVLKQPKNLFKRLDVPGIIIFSVFLLALLLVLIQHTFNWTLIVPVISLLGLLIVWERRHETPFIDVRLLGNQPSLLLVYIRAMATSYILYAMLYGLPQWLEGVRHFNPAETGLFMLPDSIIAIAVGMLISKGKNLFRQNFYGVVFMIATCAGIYSLNKEASILLIVVVTVIMGIAEGLNLIANQALLNAEAPLERKGVSFGLYRTFAYLGAIISSSQLKVLFHTGITDDKFHVLSYTCACSCVVLTILLIPLWKKHSLQV